MSKAGAGKFLAAIVLASFTSTGAASAQSQVVQTTAKEQATRPQSTNQIVGATEEKPLEPRTSTVTQNPQPQKPEPKVEVAFENAVIPPAPVIVKRSTKAIMIPVDGAGPASKERSDSKYEERPVLSSSVSVGSVFGYRRDPFTRRAKFHSGVDIKARWGDPVGASQAGIVQFAGWYHGYGNLIVVAHGGGVTTHYAHLSSFDVEAGARVERGTIIGRAGSTGRATSPHLHYEVRLDGNPLNPFQPLALDPSSEYFKLTRPTVDTGRTDSTSLIAPLQDK
ncbi:MAG TPA: M23 family metallopeptidase [Blastocatellia bacterium]|nr:M23 family metallopeptidase [Blastocatellia bacterium]